jgi:hypothetical protein
MPSDQGTGKVTVRDLSRQVDLLVDQVSAVDDRLTGRVADLDERVSERMELLATALGDSIGRLDAQLAPLQENVAALSGAVSTLTGLDGIAQELAELVDLARTVVSVLGPPAPPGRGVAIAITRLTESTSPDLELGELQLDNAASPFIGDPGLYLIETTGRTQP